MAQDRVLGEQIDVVDLSGDLAANPTAIGNLATGITNDPGATATLDLEYVRRDGTTAMSGTLTVNSDIVVTGTVDGRDVALDGSTQDTHIGDTTLHFTVASINHQSIIGAGTNTHSSIDTHIGDATLHFTEASISHANIQNVGTNTHTAIDAHIADTTLHFSEASINHQSITGAGTNTHAEIDTHIADNDTHILFNDPNHNIYTLDGGSGGALSGAAFNLFVGDAAGKQVTSGSNNTLLGHFTGEHIITGGNNVAVGVNAINSHLTNNLTGSYNVAVGAGAGKFLQLAAANNVCIGAHAGYSLTTGSSNVIIGDYAGPTTNQSDQLFIDNAKTDTPLIHGNFSTNVVTITGSINVSGNAVLTTISDIEDLNNVVVTGSPAAVTNEILRFDGANWVNSSDTGILSLIEDTTPELGGDLSINGFDITTGSGANGSELSLSDTGTTLRGGNGTGTTGGAVSILGGTSDTSTAGSVTFAGGAGVTGGNVSIGGGTGTTNSGGDVQLNGGATTNGWGGTIFLQAGSSSTSNAGRILIQPGTGTYGAGLVQIGPSDAGAGTEVTLAFKENAGNGINYVALKAPASVTTDRTWTLPQDDPSVVDGQFLTTDASGVLSFAVVDINLVDDLTPQLGGNLSVNNKVITSEPPATATSNGNVIQITSTNGGATSGTGGDINITSGSSPTSGAAGDINITTGNSVNSASGTITLKTGSAGNNGGHVIVELGHGTAAGSLIIAGSSTSSSYRPTLRFLEASVNGSNYVELRGPTSVTANRLYTLPQDDPNVVAGDFLTTDTGGNLSFVAQATTNITVDNFTDTTDYTSGTTTQLTLSVDPGTENNISVIFDGVVQHHDQYSISGTTLTFTVAIPIGTNDVEVVIGTTLVIGTPADGTVTNTKLASDVVKSHGGRITSAGATTVASAGLVITKPGTGSYLVTHNWGHVNYAPTATVDGTAVYVTIGVVGINTFEVKTYTDGTTTAVDAGFTFNVAEW